MTCYLIRHGKDDDTVRGGWSGAPLMEEGILQTEELASRLLEDDSVSIAHIYSSDLPRARQTADILSRRLGAAVTEIPGFRETNNGMLAGMKNEQAERDYPGLYWNTLEWDERYPGGESPHEFYDRIFTCWERFRNDQISKKSGDVALVTHAGVINVILCIENSVQYSNRTNQFLIKNAGCIAVPL